MACSFATRARLGDDSCSPIGPCAAVPAADADTFVDKNFVDAQLDKHHVRTLSEALATADSKVIDVAPGTYAERIVIPRSGLRIVGRCASQVILDGRSFDHPTDGIVVNGEKDVRIEGVTIRENAHGIYVRGGGSAEFVRGIVEKSVLDGVRAEGVGSSLVVTSSVIRDGYPGSFLDGRGGVGASAGSKAALALRDSTIDSVVAVGVLVDAGGKADVLDTVIRNVQLDTKLTFGIGILAQRSEVSVKRTVVQRVFELGLGCLAKSTCALEDSLIADVAPGPAGGREGLGRGVEILDSSARVVHTTITRSANAALWVEGTGATLEASKSALLECGTAEPNGALPPASAVAMLGGHLTLRQAIVFPKNAVGIWAMDQAKADLEHVLIDRSPSAVGGSHGINATHGSTVTVSDVFVSRAIESGVWVDGAGSSLRLTRTVVSDTHANASAEYGFGVAASGGAELVMKEAAILRSKAGGIIINDPGTVGTLEDTVVAQTEPQLSDGKWGRGLQLEHGAHVSAKGLAVYGNTEVAVAVADEGTSLEISNALLSRTRESSISGAGRALACLDGATATLRSSVARESVQAAVSTTDGSRATLFDVLISGVRKDSQMRGGHGGVVDKTAILSVLHGVIERSDGAALTMSQGTTMVSQSTIRKNAIAIFVQDGVKVEEVDTLPEVAPPNQMLISRDTTFVENQTQNGSGTLAIPELSDQPQPPGKK